MNEQYYNNCNGMIHKVKNGDTLYLMSRMYNVRIDELIDANPLVNVYNMQIGDEICIPIEPKPMPKYNKDEPEEDFYEIVKRFDK